MEENESIFCKLPEFLTLQISKWFSENTLRRIGSLINAIDNKPIIQKFLSKLNSERGSNFPFTQAHLDMEAFCELIIDEMMLSFNMTLKNPNGFPTAGEWFKCIFSFGLGEFRDICCTIRERARFLAKLDSKSSLFGDLTTHVKDGIFDKILMPAKEFHLDPKYYTILQLNCQKTNCCQYSYQRLFGKKKFVLYIFTFNPNS